MATPGSLVNAGSRLWLVVSVSPRTMRNSYPTLRVFIVDSRGPAGHVDGEQLWWDKGTVR